ncbi:MAG: undecaprenyl/decaprenyl-phosphate alpha-N-acetylglucosaminyl 1-phosphate transferase [Phycisphaerales bacterium]|nr:undecaprenyl/decaprenyl-phosphate alpha-N-acetylglucosaminyl 1-phosphate transferase [Phycisphaerales bacterium]
MIEQLTDFSSFDAPDSFIDQPMSFEALAESSNGLFGSSSDIAQGAMDQLDVLSGYILVFAVAFLVTVLATPLIRKLAIANGIVDHPSEARKIHKLPIAYLGGVGVYLGIIAGLVFSYIAVDISGLIDYHPMSNEHLSDGIYNPIVPPWIALGMTSIVLVGLLDDITGIPPRVKLGGQLAAAAALALGNVGINVAAGVLTPTLGRLLDNPELVYQIPLPMDIPMLGTSVTVDLIYWSGTAIIAIFVLGACNASNFIDGLDGLLTGVTSIAMVGLLAIALTLAVTDDGPFDAPRIIFGLAVLGACLGFLPHNFNPASIFLGDTGSLLLGYCSAVMILSLGDTGKTWLVAAGLIIYAIPIIDTALAIIRRKLAGRKMSDPDADHLHHMLKRAFGVKGAVFTLYGIGLVFCLLGVMLSYFRGRLIYALVLMIASYIGVYAIKVARQSHMIHEASIGRSRKKQGNQDTSDRTPKEDTTGDGKVASH